MLDLEGTRLRAVERRDLGETRTLRANPAISQGTIGRPLPITEVNEEAWFSGLGDGAFPTRIVWAVAEATDDQAFAGIAQLADLDWIHRTAWFGIWIDPNKQDRGHGRRAAWLCCNHAFNALGLRQIRLRVVADNDRARSLYEGMGFVTEGTQVGAVLGAGTPLDVIVMRLDAGAQGPPPSG